MRKPKKPIVSVVQAIVVGVVLHTALVQTGAVLRAKALSDAEVAIAQLAPKGINTFKVAIETAASHVFKEDLPDSSPALTELAKGASVLSPPEGTPAGAPGGKE